MPGHVGKPPIAPIIEVDPAPVVEGAPMVVLNEDEHHQYENFRKMDLP